MARLSDDIQDLLEFAEAYAGLGSAVQEQLITLLDEQEDADLNPNAVDMIEERLGGFHDDIDLAIGVWRASRADQGDEDRASPAGEARGAPGDLDSARARSAGGKGDTIDEIQNLMGDELAKLEEGAGACLTISRMPLEKWDGGEQIKQSAKDVYSSIFSLQDEIGGWAEQLDIDEQANAGEPRGVRARLERARRAVERRLRR